MSESKSQDPKGQSSNDDAFIDDYDDKTALNVSIGDALIAMPLFPQETFTNPPTYSREETERCLQQAVDLFWADDQTNGTIKPESTVTEAPTPTNVAPTVQNRQQAKTPTAADASVPKSPPTLSAEPNAKPIPQARARGAKRTREPKPSPRAAKRPADRNGNGQPATKKVKPEESMEAKAKPPRYRPITPKIPVPYQQQAFRFNMPSRADFQCLNDPAWLAAHPEAASIWNELLANHRRDHSYASQQARIGIDPRGIASSHNGNIPWSSPMLPQQQLANEMTMGSSPPSPMSSSGEIPTATEDPLPYLNISMRPGRQVQNSCIDRDPLMTGVTTNHPSLGNLQSLRHPATYPLNVPGAFGYNHASGNLQTRPRSTSSQPNMSAQYSFGPLSGAGLSQFRASTADELQRRRAHEAALRARFEQNGRR